MANYLPDALAWLKRRTRQIMTINMNPFSDEFVLLNGFWRPLIAHRAIFPYWEDVPQAAKARMRREINNTRNNDTTRLLRQARLVWQNFRHQAAWTAYVAAVQQWENGLPQNAVNNPAIHRPPLLPTGPGTMIDLLSTANICRFLFDRQLMALETTFIFQAGGQHDFMFNVWGEFFKEKTRAWLSISAFMIVHRQHLQNGPYDAFITHLFEEHARLFRDYLLQRVNAGGAAEVEWFSTNQVQRVPVPPSRVGH